MTLIHNVGLRLCVHDGHDGHDGHAYLIIKGRPMNLASFDSKIVEAVGAHALHKSVELWKMWRARIGILVST